MYRKKDRQLQKENVTVSLDDLVPENHLSREYRDLAGISNQLMARAAEEVYLVACGLPVNIKKLAEVV